MNHDIEIFINFIETVRQRKEDYSLKQKCRGDSRPKNLYLIRSPRKNNPNRKLWRVKRQCFSISVIKHFEEKDKNSAEKLAKYLSSLTKTDFVQKYSRLTKV